MPAPRDQPPTTPARKAAPARPAAKRLPLWSWALLGVGLVGVMLAVAGIAYRALRTTPPSPPPSETVVFGKGFSNLEKAADGSWRWAAEEGVAKLWNYRGPATLQFNGRAPADALPQSPTIRIFLNGELLDEFPGKSSRSDHRYRLAAEKLGRDDWLELKITTSDVVIPSKKNASSRDHRHLGYQLYNLEWKSVEE